MPGVLLIHGFTGSPYELRYLGDRLHRAGYSISIPRLPGHGTNRRDFLLTKATDWFRCCIEAYLELKRQHSRVFVAGLSMGAVLAILLASVLPVERMALMAPALAVRNRAAGLASVLGLVLGSLPRRRWKPNPVEEEKLQILRQIYDGVTWVRPVRELNKLRRTARRRLSSVPTPTLIIVSKSDETVPPEAASVVESRIRSSRVATVVLETSSHLIPCGIEKDTAANEILAWFSDEIAMQQVGST